MNNTISQFRSSARLRASGVHLRTRDDEQQCGDQSGHWYKRAFTLIELSVVLMVIALLMTLVTTAGHMLSKYRLKSIMEDIYKVNSAFVNFKQIYKVRPGDMVNATTTFSAAFTIQNGNGNDIVDNNTNEAVAALQHMSLAGLLLGQYNGTWSITNNMAVVMPSRYAINTGYYLGSTSNTVGAAPTVFDNNSNSSYNTIIVFARAYDANKDGTITWSTEGKLSALTPLEAQELDTIYDDGLPSTGLFIAADGTDVTAGTCVVTSGSPYTYNSNLTTAGACYVASIIDRNSL